ncbi:MAG TPA: cytochrome c, partial [Deinococcales bacterium]|nr:cytochrome c [Deinococcales bacterium]
MTLIRKSFRAVALILAVLSLAACDGSGPAQQQQAGSSDSAEPLAISEPRAPETDASEQQVPDGEDDSPGTMLFAANCAVCHGSRGGGGLGPALTGNQNLQNGDYVIGKVLLGGGGMPPFAGRLTSDEIATVTTYARTSWDNAFGEVKAETVEVQWSGLRAGPTLVGGVEAAAAPQPDEDTDEDSDEGDESEEENGEEDGDSEEESSEDEDNGETSASG